MSDPTPLTTRLNELRAALAGVAPAGSLATVEAAVQSLLAQGGETPTTVAGLLSGLRGPAPATLADLRAELATVKANTADLEAKLVLVGDYTYNTFLVTEKVLRVTGDEQTDLNNQWTTRGGLWQIYRLLVGLRSDVQALVRGILVDTPTDDDAVSDGSITTSGYRYAKWVSVPEGISISGGGAILEAASWNGWSMLIQTTDPAPFNGADTVSPGSWVELSGSGERFARVGLQYPVTAYLRAPVIVDPLSFVITPNGTYQPYNYGTGPWPASSMWTVIDPPTDPLHAITTTVLTRFKFAPFNNQGATVVQAIRYPGGNVTSPVSEDLYIEVQANTQFAITGGNGGISFQVTVNPLEFPS